MLKIIGWFMSIIGVIITVVNTGKYMSTSQEIQAWYYYRSDLEAYRTYLIIGLVIAVVGIITLLTTYQKNKKI